MSRGFAGALAAVLHHEGGYSNNPKDPGGSTFKGITQRTLDDYRVGHPGFPARVIDLADEHIAAIYRDRYWNAIDGDELPQAVALIAFDAAVNQGVARAIRFLQEAARVAVDGVLGPATHRALWQAPERTLVKEFAARRMHAYMKLDSLDDTFGLGWSRRLVDVLDRALRATVAA